MRKRLQTIVLAFLIVFSCVFAGVPSETRAAVSKYTWKEKVAPNYVKVIGKAKVSGKPKKGKIKYAKLDKLGRTGRAVGNINYKLYKNSKGWRQKFTKSCDPSGWGENPKVEVKFANGRVYHGYKWNRSHLIADSLRGKATRRNLITGTRAQNVGANDGKGGMAYTERLAVNWIKKHKKGSIYYSAKPIYKGKELIPRSVIVDIKTSDRSVNKRVIVYNALKGYKLNYKTGDQTKQKDTPKTSDKTSDKSSGSTSEKKDDTPAVKPIGTIVYITETGKKYHTDKSCRGLSNAKNILSVDLNEAKGRGLEPCSYCGN